MWVSTNPGAISLPGCSTISLFVGDSRNDIQAAKAAGCPSVGLTYGYNYGEAIDLSQPDVIYQSINDLLPALGLPHSENQESKND